MSGLDLPVLAQREDWIADAACRGMDPGLFFPDRNEPTGPIKAICAECPVQADCLDYAIRTGQKYGIWGGTSEKQRRQLRRGLIPVGGQPKPIQHGTVAGYKAHRRRGEDACDECRRANAAYNLDREAARREVA